MTRSPLNHGLLEVVIGLTFLAFLGTLCNTIDTIFFTIPAYPTSETTLPSFQLRTTPALLFGCQRLPPAPNIAPQINPQPCPSLVSSKKVEANPLCCHHISIIPTANNPGSIIWLPTTSAGPQHCIANQSATVSITCIIKEVNANPLCRHHTEERI
jgi:hypothetical protein